MDHVVYSLASSRGNLSTNLLRMKGCDTIKISRKPKLEMKEIDQGCDSSACKGMTDWVNKNSATGMHDCVVLYQQKATS